MELSARTDIGNKRAENQDSYRAQARTDGKAWLAVCDGMGGAAWSSENDGVMHACGHDIHAAVLYGTLLRLSAERNFELYNQDGIFFIRKVHTWT